MASEYTWPKPWLIGLYQRACEEGCIRITLRGPDYEQEWRSFKAAFLRARRKRDAGYIMQMRPEFQMVQLRYETEAHKVLIIYDALPAGNSLPAIESVDGKVEMPVVKTETPEESPEDFDATQHVADLIGKLEIDEDEDESSSEL